MKVLFFTDADKDDLYSLTILIAQCYLNSIEILGVVCDDGFLSYPQNVSMVQYWLNTILNFPGIDVYRGLNRNSYLKQQRYFPELFITSYIDVMVQNFGYDPSVTPTYKTLDELTIKINNQSPNSIFILTTGNMTTFSYMLTSNSSFKNKINKIYSMAGNYDVSGNVVPSTITDPLIVANSEYNAYLDPDSFSNVSKIMTTSFNIVPLDCTNYAPLTQETITQLQLIGTPYYNNTQNTFIKNIYTQFIALLNSTLITINTRLYMWDLVATIIFLQKQISQRYISPSIDIIWTGKINTNRLNNNQKCVLYNYIDYDKFLNAVIESIFIPIPPTPTPRPNVGPILLMVGRGRFPNNPNAMNTRIAKSLCGSVYPCPKYSFYINR